MSAAAATVSPSSEAGSPSAIGGASLDDVAGLARRAADALLAKKMSKQQEQRPRDSEQREAAVLMRADSDSRLAASPGLVSLSSPLATSPIAPASLKSGLRRSTSKAKLKAAGLGSGVLPPTPEHAQVFIGAQDPTSLRAAWTSVEPIRDDNLVDINYAAHARKNDGDADPLTRAQTPLSELSMPLSVDVADELALEETSTTPSIQHGLLEGDSEDEVSLEGSIEHDVNDDTGFAQAQQTIATHPPASTSAGTTRKRRGSVYMDLMADKGRFLFRELIGSPVSAEPYSASSPNTGDSRAPPLGRLTATPSMLMLSEAYEALSESPSALTPMDVHSTGNVYQLRRHQTRASMAHPEDGSYYAASTIASRGSPYVNSGSGSSMTGGGEGGLALRRQAAFGASHPSTSGQGSGRHRARSMTSSKDLRTNTLNDLSRYLLTSTNSPTETGEPAVPLHRRRTFSGMLPPALEEGSDAELGSSFTTSQDSRQSIDSEKDGFQSPHTSPYHTGSTETTSNAPSLRASSSSSSLSSSRVEQTSQPRRLLNFSAKAIAARRQNSSDALYRMKGSHSSNSLSSLSSRTSRYSNGDENYNGGSSSNNEKWRPPAVETGRTALAQLLREVDANNAAAAAAAAASAAATTITTTSRRSSFSDEDLGTQPVVASTNVLSNTAQEVTSARSPFSSSSGLSRRPSLRRSSSRTGSKRTLCRVKNASKVAVFKPEDEETGAKFASSFGQPNPERSGLVVGGGSKRERAAYLLDTNLKRFSSVPETALVRSKLPLSEQQNVQANGLVTNGGSLQGGHGVGTDASSSEGSTSTTASKQFSTKRGALQRYVENEGSAEDRPDLVRMASAREVHKIGILDLRIFNTDRHGGNILCAMNCVSQNNLLSTSSTSSGDVHLIPIDHALSLPDWHFLAEAYFDWQYWAQADEPFDEETRAVIASIDLDRDVKALQDLGLPESCIATNQICTLALQIGSSNGLNLKDLGNMYQRPFCAGHNLHNKYFSPLEHMVMLACEDCSGPKYEPGGTHTEITRQQIEARQHDEDMAVVASVSNHTQNADIGGGDDDDDDDGEEEEDAIDAKERYAYGNIPPPPGFFASFRRIVHEHTINDSWRDWLSPLNNA